MRNCKLLYSWNWGNHKKRLSFDVIEDANMMAVLIREETRHLIIRRSLSSFRQHPPLATLTVAVTIG